VNVRGAEVTQRHGAYADNWCEAAASIHLRTRREAGMLELTVWIPPPPAGPATARFAVQVDRDDALVFDLPFAVVVRVQLPCAHAAGRELTLSMLCDTVFADRGADLRPISFQVTAVRAGSRQLAPNDDCGRDDGGTDAGLAIRSFHADGLCGTGAPPDTLVTIASRDVLDSACSDSDGTFSICLNPSLYDGTVHELRVEAPGAAPILEYLVADPRLRGGPASSAVQPRDPEGRSPQPGMLLASSPASQSPESAYLSARMRRPSPAALMRLRRRAAALFGERKLSIIMPAYNTRDEWLRTAVDSVLAQWCPNWELICVDDSSTEESVLATLRAYGHADERITVLSTPYRMGTAAAINVGLAAADGEFVAFLDHDDFIEATAVWQCLATASNPDVDLIYSDELVTTDDIEIPRSLVARPAFSHDYYLDHPYFVHLVACRRSLATAIGGLDETMTSSADVDFILRFLGRARSVAHIPDVLYRWRTHDPSPGHDREQDATDAIVGALNRTVKRIDPRAAAAAGLGFNQFRIDWPDPGGKVLIVIPTKNRGDLLRKAITSVEVTCPPGDYRIVVIDHASDETATQEYLRSIEFLHTVVRVEGDFNFAAMNNDAVRTYGAHEPFVLFMNNDVEAVQPNWLSRLRSLAARSDVGAVCPLLLYPGDQPEFYTRVQHGGVLIGFDGAAEHAFKGVKAYDDDGHRHTGYNCSLNVVRDFSAVTGACLLMRRGVFDTVQGFDETLRVGFNDTDLCLRAGELGYKVLYDGHTVLYHHESATRRPANLLVHDDDSRVFVRRWARMIRDGDDFYSPLLAPGGADHVPIRSNGDARSRSVRLRRAGLGTPAFGTVRGRAPERSHA
jgi:GT2 family glycosyltransferase